MEDFRIESVLVTGSDRGIGLGLVLEFMKLPHPPQLIFATCRNLESPEGKVRRKQTETEIVPAFTKLGAILTLFSKNVTDPQSIKAAAEEVQRYLTGRGLALLINNAGIAYKTTLASETAQTMAAVYTTNTLGPMRVSQTFLPLLKRAAPKFTCLGKSCFKAAIVNVSSSFGSLAAVDEWKWCQDVGYRCSKAALNMLTKCQSLVYYPFEIVCVSLHPGGVQTGLGAEKGGN
ncbi:short chain dehydrogenase gsfK-like [Sphaerodactylus townsendi]|uniref:short chain dehydrogenase gsfK-like n=1 Tax=Sphaerodactylus townsendi TaxID=933632 RepID=UPI002025C9BA|nr:short chain dehydrogenase gsfK-like [Sphaerodactylus townsendi]